MSKQQKGGKDSGQPSAEGASDSGADENEKGQADASGDGGDDKGSGDPKTDDAPKSDASKDSDDGKQLKPKDGKQAKDEKKAAASQADLVKKRRALEKEQAEAFAKKAEADAKAAKALAEKQRKAHIKKLKDELPDEWGLYQISANAKQGVFAGRGRVAGPGEIFKAPLEKRMHEKPDVKQL